MKRRKTLLALLAIAVAPHSVRAQQTARVWRIGYLGDGFAATRADQSLRPFQEGLADLGYIIGRNTVLEVRWTEGSDERLAQFSRELARLNVDVIVTHGATAALAMKTATTTIPIVVAVSADYSELVKSFARPEGNLTGMTDQVTELAAKEVQLLKETLPKMQRLALIWESTRTVAARWALEAEGAARTLGIRVQRLPISNAGDIELAFDLAAKGRADGALIMHTPLTVGLRVKIAQLALAKHLPLLCAPTQFADAGALMSYGTDLSSYFRRAAIYVDKILKGAKPSDLPVEQPTKFDLVINLKTAKTLGIKIPQSVLIRADRVIE